MGGGLAWRRGGAGIGIVEESSSGRGKWRGSAADGGGRWRGSWREDGRREDGGGWWRNCRGDAAGSSANGRWRRRGWPHSGPEAAAAAA